LAGRAGWRRGRVKIATSLEMTESTVDGPTLQNSVYGGVIEIPLGVTHTNLCCVTIVGGGTLINGGGSVIHLNETSTTSAVIDGFWSTEIGNDGCNVTN